MSFTSSSPAFVLSKQSIANWNIAIIGCALWCRSYCRTQIFFTLRRIHFICMDIASILLGEVMAIMIQTPALPLSIWSILHCAILLEYLLVAGLLFVSVQIILVSFVLSNHLWPVSYLHITRMPCFSGPMWAFNRNPKAAWMNRSQYPPQ